MTVRDGVRLKRRLLESSPLTGREVRAVCIAPERGSITRREAIHITSGIIGFCTILGAIVGSISLVLYLHDRKKK